MRTGWVWRGEEGGLKRKKAVKKLLVKEKRGSGKSTTTKYVFWNMSVSPRSGEQNFREFLSTCMNLSKEVLYDVALKITRISKNAYNIIKQLSAPSIPCFDLNQPTVNSGSHRQNLFYGSGYPLQTMRISIYCKEKVYE